jgi:hypothetical protein
MLPDLISASVTFIYEATGIMRGGGVALMILIWGNVSLFEGNHLQKYFIKEGINR